VLTTESTPERFELVRPIGAGGLGVVWEAVDRSSGARVALKSLLRATPEAITAFKREFRALSDVRHPNLVRLEELFLHDGIWFFSMELVHGSDLLSWVESTANAPSGMVSPTTFAEVPDFSGSPPTFSASSLDHEEPQVAPPPTRPSTPTPALPPRYDEGRLRHALQQLAQGLCALHGARLVHRDVKPSNVLVTSQGRVVLLDFGLVADQRAPSHAPRAERQVAGTVRFMSPEQARGEAVGPSSDWYAVGVILHRMLSGRWPFEGPEADSLAARRAHAAPSLRERGVRAPADLVDLCDGLLAFDPRERPDGAAVLAALAGTAPVTAEERAPHDPEPMTARDAPLVGRESEVAHLLALVTHVQDSGASLLVEGPPGSGKSAVVNAFLERVSEDAPGRPTSGARSGPGVLVLAGRCYERESVAYNGFDGVIDGLVWHLRSASNRGSGGGDPSAARSSRGSEDTDLSTAQAAALLRVFPALAAVPALTAASPQEVSADPAEVRAAAFDALRVLLDRIGATRPVVIWIDDLHWAGAESRRLWEALASRPPRLLLIGTRRTDGTDAGAGPASSVLRLAPLDDVSSALLVERLLGGQRRPPSEQVARLVRESRGDPLLLTEAVRALGEGVVDPSGRWQLGELIRARVSRLGADHRHVLDIVAVSGEPIGIDVLARAAGLKAEVVRSAVADLGASRQLRVERSETRPYVTCIHGHLRETVLAALSPETRRELHAALAQAYEAVAGRFARPEVLLAHLEGAGRSAEAAVYAREAARHAEDVLAFDRAAHLYTRALALGVAEGDEATRIAERRAEALLNAGGCVDAGEAWLALADAPAGTDALLRRGHLRRAAESLFMHGQVTRAMRVFHRALQADGLALTRNVPRLLVATLWHSMCLRLSGLRFRPRDASTHAPEDLARLDALSTASRQLSILDPVLGFSFRVRALRLALRLGSRDALVEGLALHAVSLSVRGGRSDAQVEEHLQTAGALAATDADRAVLAGCRGTASLFAGQTARALDELTDAAALLDRHAKGSQRAGLAHVRLWRVKALADLGHLEQLRASLDRMLMVADQQGDRLTGMTALRLGAVRWLADDDPDGLLASLDTRPVYTPLVVPSVAHFFDARARAEVDLYRGANAGSLDAHAKSVARLGRSVFGSRFQLTRVEVASLGARLQLAAGRPERVGVHVRALRAETRIPAAAVHATLLEACAQAAGGAPASDSLRAAAEQADRLGLSVLAAAARVRAGAADPGELSALGVRSPERLLRVLAPIPGPR
jgi:serine/threonine protein kinase